MTSPAVRQQTRGPAALKAVLPKLVRVRLTRSVYTSVSRSQSSWTGVSDEAAVVSQVAGSMSRPRLVDQHVHELEPATVKAEVECATTYTDHRALDCRLARDLTVDT